VVPAAGQSSVGWKPYGDVVGVTALHNGTYRHAPLWYRGFQYDEERARGLDFVEDLGSPGELRFELADGDAVMLLCADMPEGRAVAQAPDAEAVAALLRDAERCRRDAFAGPLHRAADAYLVRRARAHHRGGLPVVHRLGRDTFIALRGLCLATGRLDDAWDILVAWAGAVSEGMLPNLFVEQGDSPSTTRWTPPSGTSSPCTRRCRRWRAGERRTGATSPAPKRRACAMRCWPSSKATHANAICIGMDEDGLLAAGQSGVQLTWMDAKIGDWVVTPRTGKPVEVQALWLNALRTAAQWDPRWNDPLQRGLGDVSDALLECAARLPVRRDRHGPPGGRVRRRAAPQPDPVDRGAALAAAGGRAGAPGGGRRGARAVDPLWLRSLAEGEGAYTPRYEGDMRARDAAYHQGTVWPWLAGPFVEAWVRVRGNSPQRSPRLAPLPAAAAGPAGRRRLGHLCEIADAQPPHAPRGARSRPGRWGSSRGWRWGAGVRAGTPARGSLNATAAPREGGGGAIDGSARGWSREPRGLLLGVEGLDAPKPTRRWHGRLRQRAANLAAREEVRVQVVVGVLGEQVRLVCRRDHRAAAIGARAGDAQVDDDPADDPGRPQVDVRRGRSASKPL